MLCLAGCPAAARPCCRAAPSHALGLRRAAWRLGRVQARQARRAARRARGTAAQAGWGGGPAADGGSGGWQPSRAAVLNKFVSEADPGIMQQFEAEAHPEVLIAMRQTITSMLGTLPPQFFRVVISTEAENLAQLMYSVLMSGYMFANAWTRLSLSQSMSELPALPALLRDGPELVGSSAGSSSGGGGGYSSGGPLDGLGDTVPAYAPGSQKVQVEGEVLRWHNERGKEVVPALAYIEQLEAELAELRQQMEAAQQEAARLQPLPGNLLLDHLKTLSPEELMGLTDCASDDVLDAMNLFVHRLMGMEEEAWQGGTSDCTAGELAQLMYWLMITGYTLRQLEQRCDLTRTLDLPAPEDSEPPGLPPGRQR